MTRPSEIAWQRKKDSNYGILFQDYDLIRTTTNKLSHYFKLSIYNFKNRKTKKSVKTAWLGNSSCGRFNIQNSSEICPCNFINPFKLLKIFLSRKFDLARSDPNTKLYSNTPLLTFKDNSVFTTNNLRKIAKDIAILNKLPEIKRYSCYSFRIGGTSLANINNISQPKILRFVGWKAAHLPHVSMRYMRYNETQLSNFIFELIHGFKRNNFPKVQNHSFDLNGTIFDPWASAIDTSKWSR